MIYYYEPRHVEILDTRAGEVVSMIMRESADELFTLVEDFIINREKATAKDELCTGMAELITDAVETVEEATV